MELRVVDVVSDVVEDVVQGSWDDPPLRVVLEAVGVDRRLGAEDGEGLAAACLPVGHDGPVVAFDDLVDDVLADQLEGVFLRRVLVQHPVDRELTVVVVRLGQDYLFFAVGTLGADRGKTFLRFFLKRQVFLDEGTHSDED